MPVNCRHINKPGYPLIDDASINSVTCYTFNVRYSVLLILF